MSNAVLWLPGKFESLNVALDQRRRSFGKGDMYAQERKKVLQAIGWRIRKENLAVLPKPVHVSMLHCRTDRRTDPDNFIAVAKKHILDALQRSGCLEGDGWAHISGFTDYWERVPADRAGVLVLFQEHTKQGMIEKWTNLF